MKKISQIETGGRFLYGGVEWVKLYAGDGTVAISAEPVFERAFDEDSKNDWRSSSCLLYTSPRTTTRPTGISFGLTAPGGAG